MKNDELAKIISKHKAWLNNCPAGKRADLTGADLRRAVLIGAVLTGAVLIGADLTGANLTGAALIGADLTSANLTGADLTGANLRRANLTGADLTHANLTNANLRRADLTGADLDYSAWPLYCGSLYAKIDKRLACQLLYHAIRAMQSVDDKECKRICKLQSVITLANQFHRAPVCGIIKRNTTA